MPRSRRARIALVTLALLVAAFAVPLFHGSARSLPREPFTPPAGAAWASWDDVLARAPRVQLVSLDTGAVHVSRTSMLGASHAGTASYVEEPSPLRVYAHLVRHPTAGDVLVDSGLDATFRTDRYGNLARPARWIVDVLMDAPYSQDEGEDVMAQLARLDAHPHTVLFTHLHMDHTAGIPALSAAFPGLRLVTGPEEADDWVGVFGFGHVHDGQRWHELDFTQAIDLPPLGPSIDVFGDGSFWAVSTPGHSRGHVSFVVLDEDGPVLLTGDATHFRWAFAHDVGPQGTDEALAQESLDRLRAFAAAYPEVRVHTGHEAIDPGRTAQAALLESPQSTATSSR